MHTLKLRSQAAPPVPNRSPGPATAPADPEAPARLSSPLLLTVQEACRLLAVSERTLWRLTSDGRVRAVKVGRAVRYAPADLEEYVDRLRAQAATRAKP